MLPGYVKTKKEGVSRTYKGSDGFAPMAAYLGQAGWWLKFELREGSQNCQKGTPELLARALARARRLTDAPLLLRLDNGNDAIESIATLAAFEEQHPDAAPVHDISWLVSAPLGGADGHAAKYCPKLSAERRRHDPMKVTLKANLRPARRRRIRDNT